MKCLLFLCGAAVLRASSIIVSGGCTAPPTPGTTTTTGDGTTNATIACGLGDPNIPLSPHVYATAGGLFGIVNGNTAVFNAYSDSQGYAADGTADVNVSAVLRTDGPIRAGVLVLQGGINSSGQATDVSFSFGSVSASCVSGVCTGPLMESPITLGTTMDLTAASSTFGNSDGAFGASSSESFNLLFFEADGLTPVPVFDPEPTPEAGTWANVGLGLGLCGVYFWRRQASGIQHS